MSSILLTIKESDKEVISGIPEFVEITANTLCTIFYTLDGSVPTENSLIYVGKIFMPTDGISITLMFFATDGIVSTPIEVLNYRTILDTRRHTRTDDEGVIAYDSTLDTVDSLGYDSNGNPVKKINVDKFTLEFVASKTNNKGERIKNGETSLSFINLQTKKAQEVKKEVSRPSDMFFDPQAKVVILDGQFTYENDMLRIYNRPNDTFGPSNSNYKKYNNEIAESSLVTGGLVRYMYNGVTGKITFYYAESRDNKWIISNQQLDELPTFTMSKIIQNGLDGKVVFRWVRDRTLSKIY